MALCDTEGLYNGQPYSWQLDKFKDSQAVTLQVTWSLFQWLKPPKMEPIDVRNRAWDVSGKHWIFSQDGKPDERSIRTLVQVMGWSGDLLQFRIPPGEEGAWTPPACEVRCQAREWADNKGNKRSAMQVQFVNPVGSLGRSWDTITDDDVAQIISVHGPALAAMVDQIKTGKKAPPAATHIFSDTGEPLF